MNIKQGPVKLLFFFFSGIPSNQNALRNHISKQFRFLFKDTVFRFQNQAKTTVPNITTIDLPRFLSGLILFSVVSLIKLLLHYKVHMIFETIGYNWIVENIFQFLEMEQMQAEFWSSKPSKQILIFFSVIVLYKKATKFHSNYLLHYVVPIIMLLGYRSERIGVKLL